MAKGIYTYQRPNGTWCAEYQPGKDPATGLKPKKIPAYGKTEEEAREKLLEKVTQIKTGTYLPRTSETVESWFTSWLDNYVRLTARQSTTENYDIHIKKHIIPRIGKVKLTDLNVDILQKFFNEEFLHGNLKTGDRLSEKTLRNIYITMHTGLQQAVSNGIIKINNLEGVKLPKSKKHEMRVLSIEEHQRLISEVNKSTARYKIGLPFSYATGMRIGEVCAIKWENLDFESEILHVRHTLARLPSRDKTKSKTEIVVGPPKSESSKRDIPMPHYLVEILKAHREVQNAEKLLAGEVYNDSGYVLCNELGHSIEPRTLQDTFKKLIKNANIDDASFHCLRHTFATRAIEAGCDIKTLSEILGHSDVSTTLNKYGHSLDKQKKKMMSQINAFYEPNNTVKE